jgi:hypothetical protein
LLTLLGDVVPLIGDAFSSAGPRLAPGHLGLTPRQRLLTLLRSNSPVSGLALWVGAVVTDHNSP